MTVHRNSDVIECFCSRILFTERPDEEKSGAVTLGSITEDKSGRRLGQIRKK